jgi:hypothetical protein
MFLFQDSSTRTKVPTSMEHESRSWTETWFIFFPLFGVNIIRPVQSASWKISIRLLMPLWHWNVAPGTDQNRVGSSISGFSCKLVVFVVEGLALLALVSEKCRFCKDCGRTGDSVELARQ